MKKSNLYYALLIKFGTMEKAAKVLGTTPETLEQRALGKKDIPFRFMHKIVDTLGIADNGELIDHVLFSR